MKVGIISLAIGDAFQKATKFGFLTKQDYANTHGYEFIYETEVFDNQRPIAWSKILLIKKHLKNFDYLFWSDADSLIMNSSIKLESFIDSQKDLIITCDPFGLNTGQFFIRNSPFSFKLLSEIYEQRAYLNHPTWEQKGLKELLKTNFAYWKHIHVQSQRKFNSTWPFYTDHIPLLLFHQREDKDFQEKDFIVHCCGAGKNLQLLEEEMKRYYKLRSAY